MHEHRMVRAARGLPVDKIPLWFMRQAGRFMPQYREIRKKHSMLEVCRSAELSARVTMLPIELLPGIDAAIIFSDLLIILEPMGIKIDFVQHEGPQIANPVTSGRDVEALRPVEPESDLQYVLDAIRIVRRDLAGKVPLIGFAGAPFTLASYVIEGGGSKNYTKTKALMLGQPDVWKSLLTKIATAVTRYLRAQIAAGAEIVQLFDSWVGALSPEDYRESVLPYSKMIFDGIRDLGVPAIHFGTDSSTLLELIKQAGGDVIGVDWRLPLDEARRRLGATPVMGNLEPAVTVAPRDVVLRRVDEVLARAGKQPGYIFNLGHGCLPETSIDNLIAIIERVHSS